MVKDLDCSLVQVQFNGNNRLEWIYRGSSRLSPLYEEEKAAKERMQHKTRAVRSTTGNTVSTTNKQTHKHFSQLFLYFKTDSKPYVQYSRDDDVQIVPNEKPAPRAVAKKSTARTAQNQQTTSVAVPFLPQVTPNQNNIITAPPSKIVVSTITMGKMLLLCDVIISFYTSLK